MLGGGAADLQPVEAPEVAQLGLAGQAEAGHIMSPRHRTLGTIEPLLKQQTPSGGRAPGLKVGLRARDSESSGPETLLQLNYVISSSVEDGAVVNLCGETVFSTFLILTTDLLAIRQCLCDHFDTIWTIFQHLHDDDLGKDV